MNLEQHKLHAELYITEGCEKRIDRDLPRDYETVDHHTGERHSRR